MMVPVEVVEVVPGPRRERWLRRGGRGAGAWFGGGSGGEDGGDF